MISVRQSRFRPTCELLEERRTPTAGQLDPTFGVNGTVTTYVRFQPAAELPLASGQYLAAGTTESIYQTDFALARFNADGSLDTTFAKGGYASLDFDNSYDNVSDLALQKDGKILVAGSSGKTVNGTFQQEYAVARFNADGSLDTAFGSGGKVVLDLDPGTNDSGTVQNVYLQNDNKILLVGVTPGVPGPDKVTFARLNPNGSLDTTYGAGGIARPDLQNLYSIVTTAQGDGRIAVAGQSFSGSNNIMFVALVRADGTFDPTFGAGGQVQVANIAPRALTVQADGKFLLAGEWPGGPSGFDFVVLRLNADGSTDTSWGTGGRVTTDFEKGSDVPAAIAVQADGKVLVGGSTAFGNYIGPLQAAATTVDVIPYFQPTSFALVRYNTDGSLDTSFGVLGRAVTPNGGAINRLIVQADGKILAIGPGQQPVYYPFYGGSSYLNGNLSFARYEGTGTRTRLTATGAGPGGGPHVKVYDAATGQLKFSFFAFDPNFTGGVRVAVGDVNGDGVDDIVCAAGPGGGPAVKVFDGATGALLQSFFAYDPGFTGGVYVAAGDITGSGKADIVTGADAGGGPHVKVFDGTTGAVLDQFMAYDVGFTGGVRVATGDVNGDGLTDIVTGAGPGGGPHVEVFDEVPVLVHPVYPAYGGNGLSRATIGSNFAFDPAYTGGVFVAAGDVNGDGKAELVVGQGQGINAKVRVLNAADGSVLAEAAPFAGSFSYGVSVAVTDPNEHGRAEVLAGAGPLGTKVKILNGATLAETSEFTAYDPSFPGGVFVG